MPVKRARHTGSVGMARSSAGERVQSTTMSQGGSVTGKKPGLSGTFPTQKARGSDVPERRQRTASVNSETSFSSMEDHPQVTLFVVAGIGLVVVQMHPGHK